MFRIEQGGRQVKHLLSNGSGAAHSVHCWDCTGGPFVCAVVVVFLVVTRLCRFSPSARSQTQPVDWGSRLAGHPLYLQGFPIADDLEYDGDGALRSKSATAPFALCGIDVTDVQQHGTTLSIHGVRVSLLRTTQSGPRLERKRITSTTQIFGSLRRGDKRSYRAEEQIHIIVHANRDGNFENAIGKIFLDGETALARQVPPYWLCYARTYFAAGELPDDPDTKVQTCATTSLDPSLASLAQGSGADTPAKIASPLSPQFPGRDADLQPSGLVKIHLIVRQDGTPLGPQIIRAVGGGIDEALLAALAGAKFQPATAGGTPVTAPLDLSFAFNTHAPSQP